MTPSWKTPPTLPEFYEPRDGGITRLGAFWRHSDQLEKAQTQLRIYPSAEWDFKPFPGLGTAAFLARGMVFIAHDDPHLLELGPGAVSDGSVVLVHRSLIEALNFSSLPTHDTQPRDALLKWMADAAIAASAWVLGGETPASACSHMKHLTLVVPDELSVSTTLQCVPTARLQEAFAKAYKGSPTSKMAQELFDTFTGLDEHERTLRTQSRIADALATTRATFDGEMAKKVAPDAPARPMGVSMLEHAIAHPKIAYEVQDVEKNWKGEEALLSSLEGMASALPNLPAYTPYTSEQLEGLSHTAGPHAVYSGHWMAHQQEQQDPTITLKDMVNALASDCMPPSVIMHMAHAYAGPLTSEKDSARQARAMEFCRVLANNPWYTAPMKEASMDGASARFMVENHWIWSDHYVQDAISASLLGRNLRDQTLLYKQRTFTDESLVKAFESAGDALSLMNGTSSILKQDIQTFAHKKPIDIIQAALQYAHPEVAMDRFASLPENLQGQGLLHAAQNRRALEILPGLLGQAPDAPLEALPNKQTLAHVLLNHIPAPQAQPLTEVLNTLFDRGLNPYEKDEEGFLPGQGNGERRHLLTHDFIVQAHTQWQAQTLQNVSPVAPSLRSRRSL